MICIFYFTGTWFATQEIQSRLFIRIIWRAKWQDGGLDSGC